MCACPSGRYRSVERHRLVTNDRLIILEIRNGKSRNSAVPSKRVPWLRVTTGSRRAAGLNVRNRPPPQKDVITFWSNLREEHIFEIAAVNVSMNSTELPLVACWNCPCASPPCQGSLSLLLTLHPDDAMTWSRPHHVNRRDDCREHRKDLAAFTSTALLRPQACITVISFRYTVCPASSAARGTGLMAGKLRHFRHAQPEKGEHQIRRISPSTAAPRILTNF